MVVDTASWRYVSKSVTLLKPKQFSMAIFIKVILRILIIFYDVSIHVLNLSV